MSLFHLCFTFFYIGLFTIGGGFVALTLMQQTLLDTGIISADRFYNMIAISESTPGPFGVNMATYIGYELYGIPGGILATLAEVMPSVIIIMIIAHFLQKFHSSIYVQGAFSFLRPVTTGLILVPAIQIFVMALMNIPDSFGVLKTFQGWKDLFEWINVAAYGVFAFLLFKFKLHPVFVILLGAVFGIIFL